MHQNSKAWALLPILAVLVVAGTVAGVFFLRNSLDPNQVGYPLIAALSFFASAGLVVPVPGIGSVCAGGLLLSPVLVALVASVTGTVGELTGYILGFSGSEVAQKSRLYRRIEDWMKHRGWLVIFILSILPNPIFDLAGIAAGVLRYPIKQFLVWIWMGTFLKFLIVAYACAYSVEGIMGFFGASIK